MKRNRILALLLAGLLLLSCAACAAQPPQTDLPASGELTLIEEPTEETPEPEIPAEAEAAQPPSEQPAGEEAAEAIISGEAEETAEETPERLAEEAAEPETEAPALDEDGVYDQKDDVALYIHLYGHLPSNYITKREAQDLGWPGGSLEPYAPGKCIGGGRFGNYEGLLPEKDGRTYTECDIDTMGARSRGAKRIVFSNDGLIYYTDDHYESFTLLYGEEAP